MRNTSADVSSLSKFAGRYGISIDFERDEYELVSAYQSTHRVAMNEGRIIMTTSLPAAVEIASIMNAVEDEERLCGENVALRDLRDKYRMMLAMCKDQG